MRILFTMAFLWLTGTGSTAMAQFDNPEIKKFQGRWQLTEFELAGGTLSVEEVKALDTTLTIEGNSYTLNGKGVKPVFGRVAVDPSQSPPTLVRIETDRKNDLYTWCIYEIKGDTLRLCQDVKGKGRPTEFKATENSTVVTYQRIKE